MRLPDFDTEQWMNEHENDAVYNLTDTCVSPLSFQELASMDHAHLLDQVRMDYGVISGDQAFRKEILSLYQTGDIENITLYHGCLEANEEVMLSLLNPGDRIITFSPGYQQFTSLPETLGCKVSAVPLLEETGWQPDETALHKALSTPFQMIILNNPNNPTGTLFSQELIKNMISAAEENHAWMLADEVYRGLNDEPSISDLYERGISTSSLSKVFSLAGLRLGWVKASHEVIRQLNISRDYTVISTGPLADVLGRIALSEKENLLIRSRKIVVENKQVIEDWLQREKRCSIVMPASGTVGFLKYQGIDSRAFALGILKKYGVFFVPGCCFSCENHLRIGFTCDPKTMEKGLQLVSRYLDEQA